ncbi:MAG: septum site-determining protein MinC [Gammaproteobacteria bacterium]
MLPSKSFQLKADLFTISILQLLNTDQENIKKQLAQVIKEAPKFFQSAPIVLDLQLLKDPETDINFAGLVQDLRNHNLIPIGIRGGTLKHQQEASENGLAVFSVSKASTKEKAPVKQTRRAAKLISKPVRSGQQIYAKDCDLIVTSQVSHGAELLADGNIHVYGTLRGRALAGIGGDETARIFCQQLDAELISIAGFYMLTETLSSQNKEQAQQVSLQDEKLQIQAL